MQIILISNSYNKIIYGWCDKPLITCIVACFLKKVVIFELRQESFMDPSSGAFCFFVLESNDMKFKCHFDLISTTLEYS